MASRPRRGSRGDREGGDASGGFLGWRGTVFETVFETVFVRQRLSNSVADDVAKHSVVDEVEIVVE